jgi:hypothetical protein
VVVEEDSVARSDSDRIVSVEAASYAIVVDAPDDNGRCRCALDLSFAIGGGHETIRFLQAVARWFEDTRQDFLLTPSVQKFVSPPDQVAHCPVRQEGFITAVCAHTQIDRPAEYILARQKDRVWFFWDSHCLALGRLFERDMRIAWINERRRQFEQKHGKPMTEARLTTLCSVVDVRRTALSPAR